MTSLLPTSSNHRAWSRFNFQLRLAHLQIAYEYYLSRQSDIVAEQESLADEIYPVVSTSLSAIDAYQAGSMNELVEVSQYAAYVNNTGIHTVTTVYLRDERVFSDARSETPSLPTCMRHLPSESLV